MKAKSIILSVFLFVSVFGFSQGSKYGTGEDSAQCIINLSLYSNYYKQRNYEDAKKFWKKAWHHCPGTASKNLYIRGASMYKTFIRDAEDEQIKLELVDTLELIYVDRVKHYGSKGSQYGRLGVDIWRYAGRENAEYAKKAYDYLKESVQLRKTKSSPSVLAAYIGSGVLLYKEGSIEGNMLFDDYVYALDLIEELLEENPDSRNANRAKELVDEAFLMSGAGTCDNLDKKFPPRLEKNPEDLDLVKTAVTLYKNICPDSRNYFNAVEKLYAMEKTGKNANLVATLAIKNEEYSKAFDYLKEAVELEKDSSRIAIYKNSLAEIALRKDKPVEANKFAREAINFDEDAKAKAYMLIGQAVMKANCGDTPVKKKAHYWVAYDYFNKAKSLDETFTESANQYITSCRSRFPSNEEVFMEDLEEGQSYRAGCWVNESTTVRIK